MISFIVMIMNIYFRRMIISSSQRSKDRGSLVWSASRQGMRCARNYQSLISRMIGKTSWLRCDPSYSSLSLLLFFSYFNVYCPNCGEKGHHNDYRPFGRKPLSYVQYDCIIPKHDAFLRYPQRKYSFLLYHHIPLFLTYN